MSKLHFSDDCELVYDALVNGHSVTAFLDFGASQVFMSPEAAESCGLKISNSSLRDVARGDGSVVEAQGKTSSRI